MKSKQNNFNSDTDQEYDDRKYSLYCDGLENQYEQAKIDCVFEILKVLELDEKHSDHALVEAVNYFKKKDGHIEKDAPISFLTERERIIVNKDGVFRPGLYCMLLSSSFSAALQNKSAFIKHTLNFSFDKS